MCVSVCVCMCVFTFIFKNNFFKFISSVCVCVFCFVSMLKLKKLKLARWIDRMIYRWMDG